LRLSRAQRLLADFAEAEQSRAAEGRSKEKTGNGKGYQGSKGAWDKEINEFKEINGD
jgi:hypothetical protein